ncbi:hypothetical protein M707_23630 [Arthrobacter sp. AK-YN10]|nr:hypothetical protein M707_23630 [Arthrobacter sp. AK-YN10]
MSWLNRGMRPMRLTTSRGAAPLSSMRFVFPAALEESATAFLQSLQRPFSPASMTNEKRVVRIGTSQ